MRWPFLSSSTHLYWGSFMLVAGDRHHVGPVSRCHDDSGNLGAGDVERGGAFVVRALDASAAVLVGSLVVAEHTLLQWKQTTGDGWWEPFHPSTAPSSCVLIQRHSGMMEISSLFYSSDIWLDRIDRSFNGRALACTIAAPPPKHMNHSPTQKSNDASLIKAGNTIHKEHKEQPFLSRLHSNSKTCRDVLWNRCVTLLSPSHIFDCTQYCAGFVDNSCPNPRFKLFFSSSFLVSCITHSTFTLSQSWAILPWTRSFSNPFSPFSHPGAKLPTSQNRPEHSKLSRDFFFFLKEMYHLAQPSHQPLLSIESL